MPHRPHRTRLGEQLFSSWERGMHAWWDQVLQSPAFLGVMSENLASRTQARAAYERTMETTLDRMHLPTRKDIGRVARIASLLEERLLAQEDILLEMKDQLVGAQREAVQARIEAAQARLALADEVRGLRAELARLQGKIEEVPPPVAGGGSRAEGGVEGDTNGAAAPTAPPARATRRRKA